MQTAIDDDSGTAVQPGISVPFEVKLTVPVGIGGPEGLTLAVRVTSCPTSEGFGVPVTTVVVKPVRLKMEPSPVLPPDSVVP
jgi:hypothetical protein